MKLRNALIAVVVILFVGAGVGFYFAYGWIASYSQEVGSTVAQSNASNSLGGSLTALQASLAKEQQIAQLAGGLYATSATWQTQVIKDVNTYAQASGITVTDFTLGSATAATPVPGATTGAPVSAGTTPTQTITISLGAPVSYTSLLKFMTYITYSIPKMQIMGVQLSRSAGSDDSVGITSLDIGVYVR